MIRFLEFFTLLLPRKFALKIGAGLGLLGFYIFKKRRLLAIDNLNQALGSSYSSLQQKEIIKKVFINLGINLIEFLRFQEINANNLNQFVTFHGLEHLDQAYKQQKGVLALAGHIGSWELLPAAICLSGYRGSLLVKNARQKSIDNFLTKQRTHSGLKILSGKNVMKEILSSIKAGEIIGMVFDQSATAADGIIAPFFNRPASTYKSLALLSLRTKAAIVPMYIYRDKNFHHHIVYKPAIQHPAADINNIEKTMLERTIQYNKFLEAAITAHPDQWTWTHNRWKVRKPLQPSSS